MAKDKEVKLESGKVESKPVVISCDTFIPKDTRIKSIISNHPALESRRLESEAWFGKEQSVEQIDMIYDKDF